MPCGSNKGTVFFHVSLFHDGTYVYGWQALWKFIRYVIVHIRENDVEILNCGARVELNPGFRNSEREKNWNFTKRGVEN